MATITSAIAGAFGQPKFQIQTKDTHTSHTKSRCLIFILCNGIPIVTRGLDLDILPSSICIPSSVFSGWLIGRKEDSIRNYLYLPGLLVLKTSFIFVLSTYPRIKNQVFQYLLFHIMNLRFVSKHYNTTIKTYCLMT